MENAIAPNAYHELYKPFSRTFTSFVQEVVGCGLVLYGASARDPATGLCGVILVLDVVQYSIRDKEEAYISQAVSRLYRRIRPCANRLAKK
jgi:hypothetical protein